jgi:hypothetical protein
MLWDLVVFIAEILQCAKVCYKYHQTENAYRLYTRGNTICVFPWLRGSDDGLNVNGELSTMLQLQAVYHVRVLA